MNLLPIETFREHISYHPFHFWQLANSDIPVQSSCNTLVYEHAWQGTDAAGRATVRRAIEQAEERLRTYLLYSVAPRYASMTLQYPDYYQPALYRSRPANSRGQWLSVELPEGYVQALGTERLSLIDSPAVLLSDSDSDGLNDTFTLTVSTTVTDADQLTVFFSEPDRLDNDLARWEIRPVAVALDAETETAIITGRLWQIVRPVLYQGVVLRTIDPADSANLAATLDVYQRTTDSSQQATLIWETLPCPSWCDTRTGSTDPAAIATATARVGIRDARNGILSPAEAVYNSDSGTWTSLSGCWWGDSRLPDRVKINYLAGYPLENRRIAAWLRPVVTRFAIAELAQRICTCDYANRELWHWQFDRASTSGNNDETYQVSEEDLTNPFGTRLGHIDAWRRVRGERRMPAILPY
jgi:hypothetical protein